MIRSLAAGRGRDPRRGSNLPGGMSSTLKRMRVYSMVSGIGPSWSTRWAIMTPSTGRKSLVFTSTVAPICGTGTAIWSSRPLPLAKQADTGGPSAAVRTTL